MASLPLASKIYKTRKTLKEVEHQCLIISTSFVVFNCVLGYLCFQKFLNFILPMQRTTLRCHMQMTFCKSYIPLVTYNTEKILTFNTEKIWKVCTMWKIIVLSLVQNETCLLDWNYSCVIIGCISLLFLKLCRSPQVNCE